MRCIQESWCEILVDYWAWCYYLLELEVLEISWIYPIHDLLLFDLEFKFDILILVLDNWHIVQMMINFFSLFLISDFARLFF